MLAILLFVPRENAGPCFIGFAIGEDRLILSLQQSGNAPAAPGRDIYIAWLGDKAFATAIRAAKDLRAAGCRVERI